MYLFLNPTPKKRKKEKKRKKRTNRIERKKEPEYEQKDPSELKEA